MNLARESENSLERAQASFDQYVEKIVGERKKQATALAAVLNDFLFKWCSHQQLINEPSFGRSPEQITEDKCHLAKHVSRQLERLNLAILFDNQPTTLLAQENPKHRHGYFWLMPKIMPPGKRKPLITRAELSSLLNDAKGPDGQSGFQLIEPALRSEKLADWRKRVGLAGAMPTMYR